MRRHHGSFLVLGITLALVPPAVTPPISVPGVRSVDIRNTDGSIERFTTIPTSSVFQTYGGRNAACTFSSPFAGVASDGQHYAANQVVSSRRWIFVEGLPLAVGEPNVTDPTVNRGPLNSAVRYFTVFCDSLDHSVGFIAVNARDPMLDPRTRVVSLYNGLQLVRPIVFRNPVVDRWGGLVTRYQSWLAITPPAWKAQRSNAATWRGWTLYLLTRPAALAFQVDFTPSTTRPSAAFHGVVACVPMNAAATIGPNSVPTMPSMPAQSPPGVNGPCRWTPPGPGSVTIQARISFHVTFWANGYTQALADYVWTSASTTFRTGELAAVNTNG